VPEPTRGVVPPRLRLRYAKTGRIRYTSQRDMARVVERLLRQARLPIAYSEGFSPRPLLSFSLALPTGCESGAEYIDLRFAATSEVPGGWRVVDVVDGASLATLVEHLDSLLPAGLELVAACALEGSEGSLQEEVTSCDWIVEVTGMSAAQLEERVETLLAAGEVPIERERKGKRVIDDLRPSILHLNLEGPGASPGALRMRAELATKPRGVRPAELLSGIDSNLRLVRASRTAQWIERDGQRLEPLTAGGELLGAATATIGGR